MKVIKWEDNYKLRVKKIVNQIFKEQKKNKKCIK